MLSSSDVLCTFGVFCFLLQTFVCTGHIPKSFLEVTKLFFKTGFVRGLGQSPNTMKRRIPMRIADRTLCRENCTFSFKEKIEICRQLEKLKVDVIELPAVENPKTDVLFVRTASSFVGNCTLSVCVGMTGESFEQAVQAISAAKHPRLRVEVPVSPVGME